MSKAGTKWYIYRNKKTGMELKFSKRQYFLWQQGYNLVTVIDTYVDEKEMKVGGK
jgi:hypothetical protein